jgi:crotonobetainyl-CoA:carnitine CoA-transferase CaiB-like acyl-CoA transferase
MAKRKAGRLLEDIVILDLADEQGVFCSKLLADLGATVIKVAPPKGKRPLYQLIERADILVETFSSDRRTALGLTPEQIHLFNPRLIHLSITGFGRTGPRRAYRSTDRVAAAFGGQMYVTGAASGAPATLFGQQSFYSASLFGANALLIGLRKRSITGKGCSIDLSIQEAITSALDPVMIQYFVDRTITGRPAENADKSFSLLHCRDGYIQITISRSWYTLLDLMDAEGKAADLTEIRWRKESYRRKHHSHIVEVVQGWTRNHTKHELFRLGQAMQFPWAPVASPEEIVRSPQLRARQFFIADSLPKSPETLFIPGRPYKLQCIRSNRSTPITQRKRPLHSIKSSNILSGIRVLDLTRMLSGPYATRMLGDFGAEIIKVQSAKTARGAEQNNTPYFRAWNRNKRSICLDLNHQDARETFLPAFCTT